MRRLILAVLLALSLWAALVSAPLAPRGQTRSGQEAPILRRAGGAEAAMADLRADHLVNVRDFGAAGDGATDDTAAVQAALDTCATRGTVVYPAGDYLISRGLTVDGRSGMTLEGLAGARIVARAATFHMLTISGNSKDVTIKGLSFVGASVAEEGKTALVISGGARITITGCTISHTNNAITNQDPNGYGLKVSGNRIMNLMGAPSGCGYGVYTVAQRGEITNNTFVNVTRHDVYLSGYNAIAGACYNIVSNNTSRNNGYEAIATYATGGQAACLGNVISNNTITSAVGDAIGLDQHVWGTVVANNHISGCGGIAISLNGSVAANTYPKYNVITGNTITSIKSTLGAIRLLNANTNTLVGNMLIDPGTYGILITCTGLPTEGLVYNTVIGNTILGAAGQAIGASAVDSVTTVIDDNCADSAIVLPTGYGRTFRHPIHVIGDVNVTGDYLINGRCLKDLCNVHSVTADIMDFDTSGLHIISSNMEEITGTLADGPVLGQRVKFVCKTAGHNIDITVSHHVTSDPEVIRLDAAKEWVELVWDGTDWVEAGGSGQTYP